MTYCVKSGLPIKLKDLVNLYCEILGKEINIKWGALPYRGREVMVPWSTGNILPGWFSKVSLEEGLLLMKRIN